jgi:hypothetical protein
VCFRFVALCERLKHLTQTHSKQGVALEMLLMTEEVQLNQELVCRSPVQRWNHIRKSFMEGPLAVSDRPMIRQGPSTPL